ncbi:MAG: restriction endonuclease subunit S, partial [Anaerolineaceae bacterium]
FEYGKPLKSDNRVQGDYPVFGSNGIVGYHNSYLVEAPFIIVGRKGSAGEVHYSEKNGYPIDTTFFIKLKNENRITLKYLFYVLKSLNLRSVNTQAGVPGLNRNDAYKIDISLPPLEYQNEITALIEHVRDIVEGNRELIQFYEKKIEKVIEQVWEE